MFSRLIRKHWVQLQEFNHLNALCISDASREAKPTGCGTSMMEIVTFATITLTDSRPTTFWQLHGLLHMLEAAHGFCSVRAFAGPSPDLSFMSCSEPGAKFWLDSGLHGA